MMSFVDVIYEDISTGPCVSYVVINCDLLFKVDSVMAAVDTCLKAG
jgi:hypothetical protein